MRALLDTNVILSLLRPHSEVFRTINVRWHQGDFEVVLSEDLFVELARAAAYPRLLRLHGLSPSELTARLQGFARRARIDPVEPIEPYPKLRHANDLKVLSAARHFKPDVVVTGDQDLLVLGEFEGIPILSPRAFLDRL